MHPDYNELERQLAKACIEVNRKFDIKFNNNMYVSAGGAKLEAFISDLQKALELVATEFITTQKLQKDTEAKKKIFAIVKAHARKCVENFSRI